MSREDGLAALLAPSSVAVVGASATEGKLGHAMLASLRGFHGTVHAVNPRAEEPILGYPTYARAESVTEGVDLGILCLPAPALPAALEDLARAGAHAAIVCASGFGETGADGEALQQQLARIARDRGLRLLGPNTSGLLRPATGLRASFVPGVEQISTGPLGIVAQSGGVNHALAFMAAADGLGVGVAAGLGNAVDVGPADLLDELGQLPEIEVIILALEGIPRGRELFESVARVTETKPVVALVVGRSDIGAFARSHTGNMLGSWPLARAALAQAGAVVVDDPSELLDAARCLATTRLDASPDAGVGLVSGQAGPALLIADALRASRIRLPELEETTSARLRRLLPPLTYQRNPVDTGRPGVGFGDVLVAVGRDQQIDCLAVYALLEPPVFEPAATARIVREQRIPTVFATGGPAAAVAAVRAELEAAGTPVFTAPDRMAKAVRALVVDARHRARKTERDLPDTNGLTGDCPLSEDTDEARAKDLLDAIGIRTPRRVVCSTAAEAERTLQSFGAPIVVKVLDPAIAHKTEVGGVHVGVRTLEQLGCALAAIDALTTRQPRYLLEEMIVDGIDLLVGIIRDPSFGPALAIGMGGVFAETHGASAIRLAPLSRGDAREMIDELAERKLLDGFRGLPEVDREELEILLLNVAAAAAAWPEIAELEINPLRATRSGLVALDALVTTAASDAQED